MITKIDGSMYSELLCGGIKNLEKYRNRLNELNVFPVPDGDTGTNMVMTLRYGYEAIKGRGGDLSEISRRFSSAALFGARGNSGVIISQFFKGVSAEFEDIDSADSKVLVAALQSGCKYAYDAVSNPVEGTMLTVLKDASCAVANAMPLGSIEEVIDIFLEKAKESLARTPELLPILKKANVVDSGGSGVVYFFEGVKKHLNGESIEMTESVEAGDVIDLSLFNKNTAFEYGYCVEGLIQLKVDAADFEHNTFKDKLNEYGDSVVSSLEGDKVKVHVHVRKLGRLMELFQKYGELLTVKIENMTVQHLQSAKKEQEVQKFLYDPTRLQSNYAVVAVATNAYMQRKFFEMGADVVILSEIAPSSQDFMDAFKLTAAKKILVFPNSANSILASMQAGSLYRDAKVTVLNSRSVAECYAVLSVMDFEGSVDDAISLANDTISNIYQFSIYHAVKDVKYGSRKIEKNDFFALSGKKLLDIRDTLEAITVNTIKKTLEERECDLVTIFYGKYISNEYMEHLADKLLECDYDCEIVTVSTFETVYDVTVTFE